MTLAEIGYGPIMLRSFFSLLLVTLFSHASFADTWGIGPVEIGVGLRGFLTHDDSEAAGPDFVVGVPIRHGDGYFRWIVGLRSNLTIAQPSAISFAVQTGPDIYFGDTGYGMEFRMMLAASRYSETVSTEYAVGLGSTVGLFRFVDQSTNRLKLLIDNRQLVFLSPRDTDFPMALSIGLSLVYETTFQ